MNIDFTIFLEHNLRLIPIWPAIYNPEEDSYTCLCPRKSYCSSPGKHPINARWQDTPKPENTPETINLIKNSKCGFAIATGHITDTPNSLIVIDIDLPGMSDPLLQKLPPTLTIRTRSQGLHFYYTVPTTENIKNLSTGFIDIRAEGGYVLAPPTKGYDFTPTSLSTITHLPTLPTIPRRERPQRALSYTPYGTYDGLVPCGERDAYVFHELITLTNAGHSLQSLLSHVTKIHANLEQPTTDQYTLPQIIEKAHYVYNRYSDPETEALRAAMDETYPPHHIH